MGLLDRLKSIFRRNKLLGDGSENRVEETQSSEYTKKSKFKDEIQQDANANLTPEQWQMRFLEENNCGKFIKNPYMVKVLSAVPEIANIKDKESFEKAQEYNYSVMPKDLRFPFDDPTIYLNGEESVVISFFSNPTSDKIMMARKNRNVEKSIEYEFDPKSGIEKERNYYNKTPISTLHYGYKRNDKHFGVVEMLGDYPDLAKEYQYIDLTQSNKTDIGTLDGIDSNEIDSYFAIGVSNGKKIRKDEVEVLMDEYKKRLEDKIKTSANPNVCRKCAGISEPTEGREF